MSTIIEERAGSGQVDGPSPWQIVAIVAGGLWALKTGWIRAVLVNLSRFAKQIQYAWVTVDGVTLSISDNDPRGALTDRKTFATPAQASAELEKFVARREKAGWKILDRFESPWIAWVNRLEQVWNYVLEDARANHVTVSTRKSPVPGRMLSYFSHGSPWSGPPQIAVPEYADLPRVGYPRMRFVLSGAYLNMDIEFQLGWLAHPDGGHLFWRQLSNSRIVNYGGFVDGALESRIDDEILRHESAETFRAWFPSYVRDFVVGPSIADLAR